MPRAQEALNPLSQIIIRVVYPDKQTGLCTSSIHLPLLLKTAALVITATPPAG